MLADGLPVVSADVTCQSKPSDHSNSKQIEELVSALRRGMWVDGGLLRSEPLLNDGLRRQEETDAALMRFGSEGTNRTMLEARSLSIVARAILCSALARKESRGAHFRNDYPKRNDVEFQKHSIYAPDGSVRFEAF